MRLSRRSRRTSLGVLAAVLMGWSPRHYRPVRAGPLARAHGRSRRYRTHDAAHHSSPLPARLDRDEDDITGTDDGADLGRVDLKRLSRPGAKAADQHNDCTFPGCGPRHCRPGLAPPRGRQHSSSRRRACVTAARLTPSARANSARLPNSPLFSAPLHRRARCPGKATGPCLSPGARAAASGECPRLTFHTVRDGSSTGSHLRP